jgi:hypothetical protein
MKFWFDLGPFLNFGTAAVLIAFAIWYFSKDRRKK